MSRKNTKIETVINSTVSPIYHEDDKEGLRANTELTHLDCSENLLSALDLRTNTKLTYLDCSQNLLTSIEVGANMKFTELFLEPMCKLPEQFC